MTIMQARESHTYTHVWVYKDNGVNNIIIFVKYTEYCV